MTDTPASTRRAAVLWFVTGALATTAAVLTYVRRGEVAWYLVAAATFTLVMGWSTWRRGLR